MTGTTLFGKMMIGGGIAISLAPLMIFQALLSSYAFGYYDTSATTNNEKVPTVRQTIVLGKQGFDNGSPSSIAVNSRTNLVYVSNRNSDNISVINATTNTLVDSIVVGFSPGDLVVNSNTNLIYVTKPSFGSVTVIDGSTNRLMKIIELGNSTSKIFNIGGIAVNEDTDKVYVLTHNFYQGGGKHGDYASISVIDGATNEVEQSFKVADLRFDFDVSDDPRGIAINSKTNTVYVVLLFGDMYVIDGNKNTVAAKVTIGYEKMPHKVDVNEETNMAYVSNFGNHSIFVVNGSTNQIKKTIPVGYDPQGMAIDTETNTIYLVMLGGEVAVIDGTSNELKGEITVGEFPEGAAFDGNNGFLYVTNAGSNSVSVIDTLSRQKGSGEWKTALVVGRFLYSDPPMPDQIFKIQYRVMNGTVEQFNANGIGGFTFKASTQSNGTLEIRFPRNYPYTNDYEHQHGSYTPTGDIDNFMVGEVDDPPYTIHSPDFGKYCIDICDIKDVHQTTGDCFFILSVPFTGRSEIAMASMYLLWNMPYHGDAISDSCKAQTLVDSARVISDDGTMTPLQQFRAGVAATDVACPQPSGAGKNDFILMISPKGMPFCVNPHHEGFMKARGWTYSR